MFLQVDVIVNTTGPDLILSKGLVSIALLGKASNELQKELKKNTKFSFVSVGDVFETGGHDLNCKAVFHTVCAPKDNTNANKV